MKNNLIFIQVKKELKDYNIVIKKYLDINHYKIMM
jgi:hypothetical protein